MVNDACIQEVANCCPNLEYLSICGLTSITDATIQKLADCCPQLKTLELAYAPSITAFGLNYLKKKNGCKIIQDVAAFPAKLFSDMRLPLCETYLLKDFKQLA